MAFLDSGVDATHPQLHGRIGRGWDATEGVMLGRDDTDSDGTAWDGHGTATAGVLSSTTDDQAAHVTILPVKIRDSHGKIRGRYIADGLRWAVDNGARVVNLSLSAGNPDEAERAAVAYATSKDVLVVASAGNGGARGQSRPTYPASYPDVLGVGAVDAAGRIADYSSRGPMVDLVALGGDGGDAPGRTGVLALTPGGGTESRHGTSLASPVVAGTAALIRAQAPELSSAAVAELLTTTARDGGAAGRDDDYGAGALDAARAMAQAPAACSSSSAQAAAV